MIGCSLKEFLFLCGSIFCVERNCVVIAVEIGRVWSKEHVSYDQVVESLRYRCPHDSHQTGSGTELNYSHYVIVLSKGIRLSIEVESDVG